MTKTLFEEETIVHSNWAPPTEYPTLDRYEAVAIDLETCDTNLMEMGPGWPRNDGYVIGIAISTGDFTAYYPIKHVGGGNLDYDKVVNYIKNVCENENIDKIFHNAQYDIGWLSTLGIEVKGNIRDTMVAAALIDENRYSYSLNSMVHEYLGEFKDEKKLKEAAQSFGLDPKKEMYKMPAIFVGEYAEADARLTYKLHEKLKWEIAKDNLTTIYDIECQLIKVIYNMTKRGVRVDIERAHNLTEKFSKKEKKLLKRIKDIVGFDVEIWAAASIAKAFDAIDLPYDKTEKTQAPSFTKTFLNDHPHDVPRLILQARELNKLRGTFIQSIFKYHKDGRIHAHINQIRSDTGGTVSGRFSYNHPNLQQVPSRGQFAKDIRGLFIPEHNEMWLKADYSQQEPRILTHWACLVGQPGAQEVKEAYHNSDLDFHQQTADMAGVERRLAKTIGLGVMYGMGYNKMAKELDIEPAEAKNMLADFRNKVPFMQGMLEAVMNRASSKGVIRTLLGRKCRFDLWEPKQWGVHKALPINQAKVEYGDAIKRAGTYKALNRLIQGSAADQTKKAMVDVYKELKIIPLIQVHDELDCSVAGEEQAKKVKDIMENSIELEVPSKVDIDLGDNWGQ